jgi:hypothetical protein
MSLPEIYKAHLQLGAVINEYKSSKLHAIYETVNYVLVFTGLYLIIINLQTGSKTQYDVIVQLSAKCGDQIVFLDDTNQLNIIDMMSNDITQVRIQDNLHVTNLMVSPGFVHLVIDHRYVITRHLSDESDIMSVTIIPEWTNTCRFVLTSDDSVRIIFYDGPSPHITGVSISSNGEHMALATSSNIFIISTRACRVASVIRSAQESPMHSPWFMDDVSFLYRQANDVMIVHIGNKTSCVANLLVNMEDGQTSTIEECNAFNAAIMTDTNTLYIMHNDYIYMSIGGYLVYICDIENESVGYTLMRDDGALITNVTSFFKTRKTVWYISDGRAYYLTVPINKPLYFPDDRKCTICMDEAATTCILPCGHAIGGACLLRIRSLTDQCPMCKRSIQDFRVFDYERDVKFTRD